MALACGMCSAEVAAAEAVACRACGAPHHPDCWEYLPGCSVYGCGGGAHGAPGEAVAPEPAGALTIDEGSAAGLPVAARARGVIRRARVLGGRMARASALGLAGGGLCLGLFWMVLPPWEFQRAIVLAAPVVGVLHGVVGTLLAGPLTRRPGAACAPPPGRPSWGSSRWA